jgi:DNA-binding MarR family transcriptional regulator
MKNDFFAEQDFLGFTARMKRISESLLYSCKDLYKSLELGIDPNWHLVFLMFKDKETLTMTEIADAFQITQSGVIKTINKMKAKGYLISTVDEKDKRKHLLKLSDKAKSELPHLNLVWKAGRETIKEILNDDPTILKLMSEIEARISDANYKERTLRNIAKLQEDNK